MCFPRPLARACALSALLALGMLSGLLVSASPASAQKIRPDFWGMHDNEWTTSPSVSVGAANLTTSRTYWKQLQPVAGEPNWSRLDAQVLAAEQKNAQPMIILGQTPKFASTGPGSPDYDDYMPNLDAWRAYVTQVAQKYGARLDYQIWPEPNIVENWKGTPGQMAQLTMVAYQAIKAEAPTAKVVSPALALRLKAQRQWMVKYFRQEPDGVPVSRFVDVVAIDPFPDQKGTPEDSYQMMRTARADLARIGVRKPIWSNEINYGVAGGGSTTSTQYSVAKQQSYVIRTYVLSAAARMQRTYWLGWFSTDTMAVKMTDAAGSPLAPATSYTAVHDWLDQTSFSGCSKEGSGLWVCTARRSRTDVRRIYWKPSGQAVKIKTPRSTRRVENRSGRQIAGRGARTLKVTDSPVMVASAK